MQLGLALNSVLLMTSLDSLGSCLYLPTLGLEAWTPGLAVPLLKQDLTTLLLLALNS